jgi:hypothetical protein
VFAAIALIMGFVEAVFAATVVPYVIGQHFADNFEGGSRYSTVPIMAVTAAGVVALDAYLRRQGFAESRDKVALIRQSPWAATQSSVTDPRPQLRLGSPAWCCCTRCGSPWPRRRRPGVCAGWYLMLPARPQAPAPGTG